MNKTKFYNSNVVALFLSLLIFCSCNKEWLDKKPDKALLVPTTLDDFQSLLNNDFVMNKTPEIAEVASDDYFISYETYQRLPTPTERNSYLWKEEIYEGQTNSDWNRAYQIIFFSNVVLDGLENFLPDSSNIEMYNNIKGSALFFRAFSFYNLAQIFAEHYDTATANAPGIPLRLHADINLPVTRGTLKTNYDQIRNDLHAAATLLPLAQQFKTQPTLIAVKSLLARIYLSIQQYDSAYTYANDVLNSNNALINFNDLDSTEYNPIQRFNNEVLLHSTLLTYTILNTPYAIVDTSLYKQYDNNDLRKYIFFKDDGNGNKVLKSSYSGSPYSLFSGLATDEMYLIKAECLARKGEATGAISLLNNFLRTRYVAGSYVPVIVPDPATALKLILNERRKELIFRGLRWSDLRRLNTEDGLEKTLYRELNNEHYKLEPNSLRYVFPIPPDEIAISHIEQNPR